MIDATTEPGLNLGPTSKSVLSSAERQRRYRERKSVTKRSETLQAVTRNALTITSRVTDGNVTVLCARQDKIDIAFNDEGDAIITQTNWPDEDQIIIVSRENIGTFIDNLTDALGIPSFGRPA
jgi:hypothetical protein